MRRIDPTVLEKCVSDARVDADKGIRPRLQTRVYDAIIRAFWSQTLALSIFKTLSGTLEVPTSLEDVTNAIIKIKGYTIEN